MATNEDYLRGIKVPLTVGVSIPARNAVVVGNIPGITLTPTEATGSQVATVLRKGAVRIPVSGITDAVKLTFATVTNGQTIIFNGDTYTAHTNTTTKATKTFSIAGSDTEDVAEFMSCVNDATHGTPGVTAVAGTAGVCYLVSDATITAITGTAQGATVTVDHAATYTSDVAEGDILYWSGTNASPVVSKQPAGVRYGYAMQNIADRKITLAAVANNETIIFTLPGGGTVTFTAKTSTTTPSSRFFSIAGDDTADAALLAANINHALYGISGMVATPAAAVITLEADFDFAITGTAVDNGHLTVEAGSRDIEVKLGY
jgi:hypothetical protein